MKLILAGFVAVQENIKPSVLASAQTSQARSVLLRHRASYFPVQHKPVSMRIVQHWLRNKSVSHQPPRLHYLCQSVALLFLLSSVLEIVLWNSVNAFEQQ